MRKIGGQWVPIKKPNKAEPAVADKKPNPIVSNKVGVAMASNQTKLIGM